MKDTLFASLYLGRLSRDRLNYSKTTDHRWTEFQHLKQAFEAEHPEYKDKLKEFLAAEKSKWRGLFSDLFKKQSLALFVVDNVPRENYRY